MTEATTEARDAAIQIAKAKRMAHARSRTEIDWQTVGDTLFAFERFAKSLQRDMEMPTRFGLGICDNRNCGRLIEAVDQLASQTYSLLAALNAHDVIDLDGLEFADMTPAEQAEEAAARG